MSQNIKVLPAAPAPRTRDHIFQFIIGLMALARQVEIVRLEVKVWRLDAEAPDTTILK